MAWPRSRFRTYVPGLPVFAGDFNLLEDAIIHGVRGEDTEPHPVHNRITSSGTWAASFSTATGVGSIAESVNSSLCYVPIRPPPLRARIYAAACKIKDGGGTSLLRCQFSRENDDASTTIVGNVTSAGAGVVQVLSIPFGGFEYEVGPAMGGGRFVFDFTTTGGGASARRIYEVYISWYRP